MRRLRCRSGKGLPQGHHASVCVGQVKWLRGLQAARLTWGCTFETQAESRDKELCCSKGWTWSWGPRVTGATGEGHRSKGLPVEAGGSVGADRKDYLLREEKDSNNGNSTLRALWEITSDY